ncbi:MAG: carboxymuconolactone decarboxylase family protein [Actinomycetales bacterium]
MSTPLDQTDLSDLRGAFEDSALAERVREMAPEMFDAAGRYWSAPLAQDALSPAVRELVLLAMHASAASINDVAIRRHVRRARAAGASEAEVLDTLVTIVGLANHALYSSMPVLEDELAALGRGVDDQPLHPEYGRAKSRFESARGFWTQDRDRLAHIVPEYMVALTELSTESWTNGPLSPKVRELICVAIDCTVNHTYESGLRMHIRNALRHGATSAEIVQVFQLAGLMGLEGYLVGARTLAGMVNIPSHGQSQAVVTRSPEAPSGRDDGGWVHE